MNLHISELHLAQRVADAFEWAAHHGRHAPALPPDPPLRAVPPADDWPEWHWDGNQGGNWK